MDFSHCRMQDRAVPGDLLGPLVEHRRGSVTPAQLQSSFAEHGYVLVRQAIDSGLVVEARREVFERLVEMGEIAPPAVAGLATGVSYRRERAGDLGRFWQSVSEGPRLRDVSHGSAATAVIEMLLGAAVRPHDYLFLRPGVVGRATRLHYDLPFFARGSQRIVTVWTALGEIPTSDGPLVVVEGSHRFADLIDPIRAIDYESTQSPQVQLMQDPIEFVRGRGTRLLTTDFGAGDLIVFSLTTLHGTLDNHSPIGRTRLSCDVRWQPAADPVDDRYVGPQPSGTTGAGYGELNGAKPLTEDWHTR